MFEFLYFFFVGSIFCRNFAAMKRYSYIPFSILLLTTACSTGKYVQEGEYILDKVAVVSDQSDYNAAPLSQYVRQKEKPKLFSLFRNPFSRKPVIYDTLQARLSCQDLMTAMQNEGYMNADVSLYTETKGKKLKATYLLHPGQPFLIGKVNYNIQDEGIQQLLHLDQTDNQQIKPGMRFTVETLDNERKRIAGLLSDNGYFRFNKDFIHFTADTVMGRKDIALTLQLRKYKSNSNSPEVDHTRYLIRDVLFQSNDSDRIHLRKQVLLNATAIKAGRPYDASALQRTYNNFARLQAVKYTNIKFAEVPDTNLLDCHIQISTNKPSTISFQPEGTNTAGDLGAAASITYTNRNLFHGSEQLSIEFRGAYEAITGLEGYQDQNYTEFSVETKLVFPRFLAPFLSKSFRRRQTASSEWAVSWNFQNRPEFHRRVFSSAWRYRWSEPKHHLNYRFDLLDLNYVYMPWISSTFKRDYLDNAENRNAILRYNYEDIFIMKAGFTVSYTDGVDAVRANFESAGNLLNGVSKGFGFKTNSQGQHTLFNIAYAQYVKLDFDYTHLFQFDKRNALALHAGLGVAYPYGNSTVLPLKNDISLAVPIP